MSTRILALASPLAALRTARAELIGEELGEEGEEVRTSGPEQAILIPLSGLELSECELEEAIGDRVMKISRHIAGDPEGR